MKSFRAVFLTLAGLTVAGALFLPVNAEPPRKMSAVSPTATTEAPSDSLSAALAPTPEAAPRITCYAYSTIAQGWVSGFGGYCGAPLDDPQADPSVETRPPCYTAVARPQFESIIRGQCAWEDFWRAHTSIFFPPPPVPAVDFNRFAVIAIVAGPRPDGCRGIEVVRITRESCGTKIYIRERAPCPFEGCPDVISNPFHFVLICKEFVAFETPVCFEHRNRIPDCTLTAACAVGIDPTNK